MNRHAKSNVPNKPRRRSSALFAALAAALLAPVLLSASGCVVVHKKPRPKAVVVKPKPVKVVHVHTARCHH